MLFLAENRLQARIAFESMAAMIRADDVLADRFEIVDGRHFVRYLPTSSQARAISSEMASVVGAGRRWRLSTSAPDGWNAPRREVGLPNQDRLGG